MNGPNETKVKEKASTNSLLGNSTNTGRRPEEKSPYGLQTLLNKISKSDSNTFANYYVDLGDFFDSQNDYTNYMKNYVSLSNTELAEKPKSNKNFTQKLVLKPNYFGKFTDLTLFYIFYYMARDSLQLFAAEELYKRKWKYNSDYMIWFFKEPDDNSSKDNWLYFNPKEWKVCPYLFEPLNPNSFLSEGEIAKYNKIN